MSASVSPDRDVPETEEVPVPNLPPRTEADVLVGVDGSPGSLRALRWALERADHFGTVQPLTTWHYPWWAYTAPIPPSTDQFRDQALRDADEAVAAMGSADLLPPIVCRGQAGQTLVEVGRSASLIVLGTRGRSGLRDALLGSVSSHVVAHTETPVAVIPADVPVDQPYHRVVVGVDGSLNSLKALRWATRHSPPGASIEAVHTWVYPVSDMPDLGTIPRDVYEDQARAVLQDAVDAVVRAGGSHGHHIERRLEYGDARSVLRNTLEPGDLLVLGSRGRGGVAHLLLGSVTSALLHQPMTATVVVPPGGSDPTDPTDATDATDATER